MLIWLSLFVCLVLVLLLTLVCYTAWWASRARKLVPPRGHFTTISTGRLHYVERGVGPDVLLIHGLGGQLGNFDCGLIDDLARDHHVIAIDRPGMGYSQRPSDAATAPADHAKLMFEIIAQLGLKKPLIVGHSLGGAIALAMAVQAQEQLSGLALISPMTLPVSSVSDIFEGLAIRSRWKRWAVAWTLATPGAMRHASKYIATLYGPEEMPAGAPVRAGTILGFLPSNFYHTCLDYLGSGPAGMTEQSSCYAALSLPVAILFGTGDRILEPAYHGTELVSRHPQFQLELVEGAGHMLPVTRPDACSRFIRAHETKTDL